MMAPVSFPQELDSIGHRDGGPAPRTSRRQAPLKIIAVVAGAAVVVGGGAVAAFAMTDGGSGDGGKKTTLAAQPPADAPRQPDLQAMEAQRRQDNLNRASRGARDDFRAPPALRPKGIAPTKKPEKGKDGKGGGGGGGGAPAGNPVPVGEAQRIAKSLLPSKGFSPSSQFGCLVNLWNRESGWRTTAGNPSSGAYGIPQALPGSKMASAGPNWRTDARTQITWGLGYIKGRYGTPCGAWGHFQSHNWY